MTTNNATNSPPLVNPTAHGILVGEGTGAVVSKVLADGQILIGVTGGDPVPATVTGGGTVTVTPGAGTLAITGSGGGLTWSTVASSTQAMTSNHGYVCNNGASLITYTLPATAAVGEEMDILGSSAGGWLLNLGSGQSIKFGATATTTTTGSLASTLANDNLVIKCMFANTIWTVVSTNANLTVV